MTIDNLLNWLQEAEDNNIFMVSTQSVKRHLETIYRADAYKYTQEQEKYIDYLERLQNYSPVSSCACDKPTLGKNTWTCGCGNPFNKVK